MKNIFFSIIASIITITTAVSCNQASNKTNNEKLGDSSVVKPAEKIATESFSVVPIIEDYLTLKNALVADNDKATADAGKKLLATLNAVDLKAIPTEKQKDYLDIAADAKENAEHIGDNAGKIAHQREHLAALSKDISDLIAMFGTTQKLYQDYCPMYNDGKGAIWISEVKAIKNPYYGNKMLTCGSVKKEY